MEGLKRRHSNGKKKDMGAQAVSWESTQGVWDANKWLEIILGKVTRSQEMEDSAARQRG